MYRNVEAAFAYVDDLAIYPHMPFNTPGFDPRAKQILSDWMVSIPAIRKHPEIPEYAVQTSATSFLGGSSVDTSPQPYVEVLPGNADYTVALAAAQVRLNILHTGVNPALPIDPLGLPAYSRYNDPGQTEDVVDPAVSLDPICHPIPVGNVSENGGYPLPNHPHWVNTDLTDPPGPWAPRQSNWQTVLVEQQIPPYSGAACNAPGSAKAAYDDQVTAVGLLQSATLDQVRTYATTPVPFGLWQRKSGCNFTSVPTVHTYSGSDVPNWMTVAKPSSDAPVFTQTPGAAVFKMICINCHGPKADSNGRMAQNLATMTGGNAAVADFRDGMFGPVGAAVGHRNMDSVYSNLPDAGAPQDGGTSWASLAIDDRAARYMAWMGLGGTSVNIPAELLELVAVTKVLDQQRLAAGQLSANMLSQAKSLCQGLLGLSYDDQINGGGSFSPNDGLHKVYGYLATKTDKSGRQVSILNSRLIVMNGDAELWLNLCSLANPAPVRILTPTPLGLDLNVPLIQDTQGNFAIDSSTGASKGLLVPAAVYPTDAPVGNVTGGVDASLKATNTWPWCIDDSNATIDQQRWIVSKSLPVCPSVVKSYHSACLGSTPPENCFGNDAGNTWAVRGAINAGFAVFLYVQSLESKSPPPDFNQCELLH
jgi:hypothetical protein